MRAVMVASMTPCMNHGSQGIQVRSIVLSSAAPLGVSAWVFNHVFGFPGADASVPPFGFVFLVALGVDYKLFTIVRSLLVPALAYDIGRRIWWPGRLARTPASKETQRAIAAS